jgi:aerotaxis receptor
VSFLDRELQARPKAGEAPFGLQEVFFSRTDARGVILAGNQVFSRVADYPLEEMLGAPHKIIRHPDMPKGVFQLFWDTIKQGGTVGAYVKNKARDGLHYWVFAVVTPCEGGYISARIKPTSALRDVVEKEYSALLSAERNEGLTPQESAERLLGRINDLGFASYHDFAGHALGEELLARDAGLGRAPDGRVADFREMLSGAEKLVTETEELIRDFEAMRTIPHNLRVIASRIEPAGGPVTVLSQNYGAISREMSAWFESHVKGEGSNFRAIRGTVNEAMFVETLARILTACDRQLTREGDIETAIDAKAEQRILGGLARAQLSAARDRLAAVDTEADKITTACETMHRNFLALSTTRVLCKIESARLGSSGEALESIIDQLGAFQDRVSKRLETIAGLGKSIRALEHWE